MDLFRIEGPQTLRGSVAASGAKNAALPSLAATLLTDEPMKLGRVPRVRDIRTMRKLLGRLGTASEDQGDLVVFTHQEPHGVVGEATYDLVKTMRASVLVLGPLLARHGRARVSLPGGCAIGVRPIDQHLKGLEALGAEVKLEAGYVEATCPRLQATRFRFAMPTVTGTENVMMAAVLAKGTTVLENCAKEPEIEDLAALLNAMGAKIEVDGGTLTIEGVDSLHGAQHDIIGDRIEGGTYLVGAAMTGGDVTLEGARAQDLAPLLEKLEEIGAGVEVGEDSIRVYADGPLSSVDMETQPHPGFPTDLQAQYLALMTQAKGVSTVAETVFENRFQHVPELARLGAVIEVQGNTAHIHGPTPLNGAHVMATDLRASACLVLAALVAEGETTIHRIYHLDRGYERMEEKLDKLGVQVVRDSEPEDG